MDSDPDTVVGVMRQMRGAGKAIVGMKILGQGDMRTRQDEALRYALGLGLLDAFTIGARLLRFGSFVHGQYPMGLRSLGIVLFAGAAGLYGAPLAA